MKIVPRLDALSRMKRMRSAAIERRADHKLELAQETSMRRSLAPIAPARPRGREKSPTPSDIMSERRREVGRKPWHGLATGRAEAARSR